MTRSTIARARTLAILASVLLVTVSDRSSAQAQARSSSRRDTVLLYWKDPAIATLILVDSLPGPNARAVVIRRPGDMPNNIILVTRSTSPAELAKAVAALTFSRRNKGDDVDREMRTTIVATTPAADAKPTPNERRAEADLRRVVLASEFAVRGIARGPAIVIRMADDTTGRRPAVAPPTP
jgi:hypothetical protein